MPHEQGSPSKGHGGVVTRPDIYAGAGYNPFSGVKNDFKFITSPIPSQGPTKTGRTEFDTSNRAIIAQDSAMNNNNLFAQTYGGVNPNQGLLDIIKAMGGLSGSGSGSGSGNAAANQLARDKFNYDKRQDALTRAQALEELQFGRARDARVTSGLENYYSGGKGQFNTGFDKLLGMITDQGKVSADAVAKAYDDAIINMDKGYDTAQGLGDKGFGALNAYLQANPNNPYANINAQVGSAPDALTDYLSAYGVSDTPVQGQIQADQLQAQQGAGNFQNLIDVLSGVAQQGASSRGAESEMAQLLFNTGLGQDRAGYRTQAENAQAQALAQLQQAMFQSRFGVEGDRNSLANQLATAVIQAGGNPNVAPVITPPPGVKLPPEVTPPPEVKLPPEVTPPVVPLPGQLAQTATPQQIVANQLANLLAPAQAQGTSAQQLLDQLNARRGYTPPPPPPPPPFIPPPEEVSPQELRRRQIAALVRR